MKPGRRAARELLLVTPDLFAGRGGIARIARALALACHEHAAAAGARLTVLSLNDDGTERDPRYLPEGSALVGCGGNRARLAREVILRAWRQEHAGAIFAHVNLSVLAVLVPARRRRFAVVAHGVEVWEPLSLARRAALRQADEVWPVSRYTGRVVVALHGVREERVRVIQNCIDPWWGRPAEPAPAERPFALVVTRLASGERYKGVDTAIRAFGRLHPAPGGAELWIAGDGADRERLAALAAATPAAGRIRFLGHVSEERLRELYASCAFFVLPSSKEGFGLVFLEAMASGKAVVGASAAAVPEVIRDGLDGRLVGAADEVGLAAAMELLLRDPATARRYGESGRSLVETTFGYDRYRAGVRAALGSVFGLADPAEEGRAA